MHSLVTIVAKDFIIVPAVIALIVWLRLDRRLKKEFIVIAALAAGLALALAVIGSKLFNDPRPFVAGHFTPYFAHGNDNGFPSDHTLLGSLLAFLAFKYDRRLGAIAFGFALSVGLARVLAGVHHLSDIIGSIVFAAIGVIVADRLVRRISQRANRQRRPSSKEQ